VHSVPVPLAGDVSELNVAHAETTAANALGLRCLGLCHNEEDADVVPYSR
jgi:hypothetical protein